MQNELDPISQARIHVENAVQRRVAEDVAYRDLVKRDPHRALAQLLGVDPIPGYKITVIEESAGEVTIVLPRAIGQDELPDELLDLVAGGCSADQLRRPHDPTVVVR